MKIQTRPPFAPPTPPPKGPEPPNDPGANSMQLVRDGMIGATAYLASTAFPSTYLHELGHKVAINALFQNSNPTITVTPFQGGFTRWRPSELTPLGESLGVTASRSVASMAGTAVDALSSVALFASGYKLRKRNPVLGTAMMGFSAATMATSTYYAASGIGKALGSQPGHDFLALQATSGIPCWASAAIVASILPITYLVLRSLEKSP